MSGNATVSGRSVPQIVPAIVDPMHHGPFKAFIAKAPNAKFCFQNNIHTLCMSRAEADKYLNIDALMKDSRLRCPKKNPDGLLEPLKINDDHFYVSFRQPGAVAILDRHYSE